MEDVLKVYARDFDGSTVPVCMDGTSKQQTRETRTPLPARPGQPAACDFEYERNGTANLFMACAPLDAWRHVEVTDRRRRRDFAWLLRDMADVRFPDRRIVLVTASLDTHRLSTPCEAFPPAEASRLADRFEVHHTPKHGSWPTWRRSRSTCCPASAWTAGSRIGKRWCGRSPHGSGTATRRRNRSTGGSGPGTQGSG